MRPVAAVEDRRCRRPGRRRSPRILSPTRSYIACMSSSAARPCWTLVDDRQLGGTLVGLGEQALRLVEQAGVLERDAHARGDRRQQALVGLAEGVGSRVLSRPGSPMTRSPARIGTPEPGLGAVRAAASIAPARVCLVAGAEAQRAAASRMTGEVRPLPSGIGGIARAACPPPGRTGSGSSSASSYRAMSIESRARTSSRTRSPTSSTMAWKSSWLRQRLADLVDDRELGGALRPSPRAAASSRRTAARSRGRRPCSRRACASSRSSPSLKACSLEALERDDADDLVAGEDRDAEPRLASRVPPMDRAGRAALLAASRSRSGRRGLGSTVEVRPGPSCDRLGVDPLALVDLVRERDQVRRAGRRVAMDIAVGPRRSRGSARRRAR